MVLYNPALVGNLQNNGQKRFRTRLLYCLILMLAWAIWLWRLGASDLTFDETATYFVAYRPPLEILHYLRGAVQEHPPVYYLLIRAWMALGGVGEFSLRFFSVAAGIIALALFGWVARLAAARRAGTGLPGLHFAAVALLALLPGMAYYARDARMYSLGIVWTLLASGLFLRDWLPANSRPNRLAVAQLTAVNGLALLTHYYLVLPILAQPLVLALVRRWRPLWLWCATHVVPALAVVAWFLLASGLRSTVASALQSVVPELPTGFSVAFMLDRLFFSPMIGVRFPVLGALLALAVLGILVAMKRCRPVGVWLAVMATVPLLLAYLLPRQPQSRYLLFLIPFVVLAVAHAVWLPSTLKGWPRQGTALSLGLTVLVTVVLAAPGLRQVLTLDKSRYGQTLELVKAYSRPGDEVLFYGPWQVIPFHYYDPGQMPPISILPPYAPPLLDPQEAEPVLEQLLARATRVWVLPAAVESIDPDEYVWGWLDAHAHAVWQRDDFRLYLPPLPPDAPAVEPELDFGGLLKLERLSFEPQPVPAGEALRLKIEWRLRQPAANGLQIEVILADQLGREWNRTAFSLGMAGDAGPVASYEGLTAPQGAPPGEYGLYLRVIDLSTGELLLVDGEERVLLQTVQVAEPLHAPVLAGLPGRATTTFCQPGNSSCLHLVAVEPGGVRFQQGHVAPFVLHWLAPDEELPDLQLRLLAAPDPLISLPGASPAPVISQTIPLVAHYPAEQWKAGRLVTQPLTVELPPDLPTGRTRFLLEVQGPDGQSWPSAEGAAWPLFAITVEERATQRRLPTGLTRIEVDFGGEIGLRGYHVEGSARPGSRLQLTYAWHATAQPTAIYAVFNHLLDAEGTLVAQMDGWPQEGRLLTTQWQPGEYIEDNYLLEIPPDAPPGPYTLYVGVYDAASGERLPASQNGQRLPGDRAAIWSR